AADAAAASRASALGRRRARVGLERALPRRRPLEAGSAAAAATAAARAGAASRTDHELDRLLVVGEREAVEGERDGGVFRAGSRVQRVREPRMIERRRERPRVGIDEYELVAALDRATEPETVRAGDPRRR